MGGLLQQQYGRMGLHETSGFQIVNIAVLFSQCFGRKQNLITHINHTDSILDLPLLNSIPILDFIHPGRYGSHLEICI